MDKMIIKIDEIDKVKIKDSREVVTKEVPISPHLENLSVTPNSEEQVFNHPNSHGYDEVRVEPIPDSYVEPSGTKEITENGEYNVREFEKANINVVSGYVLNIEENTLNFSKGASVNENEVIL